MGIFILGFSFFLIISLRSYSPSDPPLTFMALQGKQFLNLGGPIGAFFSSSLVIFLGSSRYLFLAIFCCLAYQMFQKSRPRYFGASLLSSLVMVVIFSAAGSLIYFFFEEPKEAMHAGGLTGYYVTQFLLKWLSRGGASLYS